MRLAHRGCRLIGRNEIIADQQHRLKETENDMSPYVISFLQICQRVRALASAAATGDATAKEALAAFAQACHSRLRDLLCDETSSQPELSAPAALSSPVRYINDKIPLI